MRLLRLTALLALTAVLASGATAGAAALITGRQVKNGSLTGKDIRDGSITRTDLSPSARGLNGAKGDTGPAGPRGTDGAPALSVVKVVGSSGGPVGYGEIAGATVKCPDSAPYALSGGYHLLGDRQGSPHATVLSDEPQPAADGTYRFWRVLARNDSEGPLSVSMFALCTATPVSYAG